MSIPTIISYSNYGYIEFAKNLLINLEKNAPNHKFVLYCLDTQTFEELSTQNTNPNFTFIDCNFNLTKSFENYNTNSYKDIVHTKPRILFHALQTFETILFIDCDVVSILEFKSNDYKLYDEYDVVFQSDSIKLDQHENPNYFCTGILLLKNTDGAKRFLTILEAYQTKFPNLNDQECIYQYFKEINCSSCDTVTDFKCGVFPFSDCINGYLLRHQVFDVSKAYFVHANHIIGRQGKIQLLQFCKQWYM